MNSNLSSNRRFDDGAEYTGDAPPYTPGPVRESTRRRYFNRGEDLRVRGNQILIVTFGLLFLCVAQAVAFAFLLPLKTVLPVMVRESESGRLTADFNAFANYVPDQNAIAFHLTEWAENVFDINASVIDDRLRAAGSFVIGDASDQLKELVRQQNPLSRLHQYPNLRRTFKRLSVNFVKDDTALIRYQLTERTGPGATPVTSTWLISVTFTRVPPTRPEQAERNPAGLYITSFNNSQESGQ